MEKWNGFDKKNKHVYDGNSFSLEVRMTDGDMITAGGYMKWPENYSALKDGTEEMFLFTESGD